MAKFPQAPDQDGYGFEDGQDTVAVQLEGGAPKVRRDQLGTWGVVDVKWTCNQAQYEAIRTFFKTTIVRGSLPFTIDLYIDSATTLTEHSALFVPKTMKLMEQQGQTFYVSAQLYVNPTPVV